PALSEVFASTERCGLWVDDCEVLRLHYYWTIRAWRENFEAVRGEVVSVEPGDTLLTAYGRMRLYDISQLPVLTDGRLAGILDESDLLLATHDNPDGFRRLVSEAMTSRLETVAPTAKIADLMPIFRKDHVAIVVEGEKFLGLITKVDLINHLRQSVA
ncbi:MAG: CBS domain-containing protein, partial [Oceanibaculum sp.]